MRRLLVTIHSDDAVLGKELLRACPAGGTVAGPSGEVSAHASGPAPDVVFVDAGPPAASTLPAGLRQEYPDAFVVVITRRVDAATLELGAYLKADAYLRRDEQPADAATALLAIAAITRPSSSQRRRSRVLTRPPKNCTPRRKG